MQFVMSATAAWSVEKNAGIALHVTGTFAPSVSMAGRLRVAWRGCPLTGLFQYQFRAWHALHAATPGFYQTSGLSCRWGAVAHAAPGVAGKIKAGPVVHQLQGLQS